MSCKPAVQFPQPKTSAKPSVSHRGRREQKTPNGQPNSQFYLRKEAIGYRPILMTRNRTTTIARTNKTWMNSPIMQYVTSPKRSRHLDARSQAVGIHALVSQREALWMGTAPTDRCLDSRSFASSTHETKFDLLSPEHNPRRAEQGCLFTCAQSHIRFRDFFATQDRACAVMRRRENATTFRDKGRVRIATCSAAHQRANAPSPTRARKRKATLNSAKEAKSSRT